MRMDQDTPLSRDGRFAATRWSLVAGLKAGTNERQRCMAELCQAYAYPVYAYLRNSGRDPEAAQRLLHGFFATLLQELGEKALEGRFRSFLQDRLSAFLASPSDRDERVADLPEMADLEHRLMRERVFLAQPELAFQRGFAVEVVARALRRLKQEADANGRIALFEALQPYLAVEPATDQLERLSATLGRPPLTLVVALKRLRSRFRELVDDELAETVSNPEDQDAERRLLNSLLKTVG